MVVKRKAMKTGAPKQVAAKRFRITVAHPMGPYGSIEEVKSVRARTKAKIPNIVFTGVKKSSRGFSFFGRVTYIKKIAAPSAVVKAHIQQSAPDAKISVSLA